MLITCPLIQEEVRQGHEPPLRLLDFTSNRVWLCAQACLDVAAIKRSSHTCKPLLYIRSQSLMKHPYRHQQVNCTFNCEAVMRLWGGQLGLIPVTCCGTDITVEGIDAWSDWLDVFDMWGKEGGRAGGRVVEELLVLGASLWRGWVIFPQVVKHLHMELQPEGEVTRVCVLSCITLQTKGK